MNITKGKFVALKPETSNGFVYVNNEINTHGAIATCYIPFPEEEGQPEANANLIAEAFNVANETGLSPRQLAGQRAELLEALNNIFYNAYDDNTSKDDLMVTIDQIRDRAQAAITKATNK